MACAEGAPLGRSCCVDAIALRSRLVTQFDLDTFLPYQLAVIAGRASRGFADIYRERFGLTIPEWRVLAHLSRAETVSVRDIHARAELEKSKVTRATQRLESAGLITRGQNQADGRLVDLNLTDEGRALIQEISPLAEDFETRFFDTITEEDLAGFRRTLDALLEAS